MPKYYWQGKEGDSHVMVIELLGRDLSNYMKKYKKLSLKSVV